VSKNKFSHLSLNKSAVKASASTHQLEEDIWEVGLLRKLRHLYASVWYLARFSMVREVLREIRNLVWRIRMIQCRNLDRQGIEIPRLEEHIASDLRESALKQCMRDMQSLSAFPRLSSLIDAELVAQSWNRGAMWALRNSRTSLDGELPLP
jgi:hypothetical protein